ncbi:MAG: CopD family protein [Bdellovibrionales bacterium]|nr:CopD family protein [Massilia sp.]
MTLDLQVASTFATVLLNLAFAIAVGATMTWLWLAGGASAWSATQLTKARRTGLGAIAVALLAMSMLLFFVSASMAEVPLSQANEAVSAMLTGSHFGLAWSIGVGALFVAAISRVVPASDRQLRAKILLGLAALAVFAYSRSMISHASANGDFNAATVADWIHLCLISVWVGEVFIAGLSTLSGAVAEQLADREDAVRYIENLSASATFALGGIFVTGLFSAWHNLGSLAGLSGNVYGTALIVKVAMVAFAALLGGFNRFLVMPKLLAALRSPGQLEQSGLRTFTLILRIEAVVLLAILVAAAILSATSPPTAA